MSLRRIIPVVLLIGSLFSLNHVIYAQEDDCSVDSVKESLTQLLEGSFDDPSEIFDDIATIQDDYVSNCTDAEEGILDPTVATEGIWLIEWAGAVNSCESGATTTATDRLIYVGFEDEQFVLQDAWVWTSLEFDFNDSGEFISRRLYPNGDIFEYILTDITPDTIVGVAPYTAPDGCILTNEFVVTLQDADVKCVVGTRTAVNIRTEPSASSLAAGKIDPDGAGIAVLGKALGGDGFLWWKIGNDEWVRSDVVVSEGNCNSVETIELN